MIPHRIQVKYFLKDPGAVALEAFVPVFHRWIQRHALDGVLIDVADYKHVPNGPGIMLIGHEADVAIDQADGRPGLKVVRKRGKEGSLQEVLLLTFSQTLRAAQLLEKDHTLKGRVAFHTGEIEVSFPDPLRLPNTPASVDLLRDDLQAVLGRTYGDDAAIEIARVENDARLPLTLRVHIPEADDLETLAERTLAASY